MTGDVWRSQVVDAKVKHPEVRPPVGSLLYLGYGPLKTVSVSTGGRRDYATVLKGKAAIQSGETAKLSIAAPESAVADIRAALALLNAYGAVGGRSRNGWGSLTIGSSRGSPSLSTIDDTSRQDTLALSQRFFQTLARRTGTRLATCDRHG